MAKLIIKFYVRKKGLKNARQFRILFSHWFPLSSFIRLPIFFYQGLYLQRKLFFITLTRGTYQEEKKKLFSHNFTVDPKLLKSRF